MARENTSLQENEKSEKDERKLPQDEPSDEETSGQPIPPFLNQGPELVRDSNC